MPVVDEPIDGPYRVAGKSTEPANPPPKVWQHTFVGELGMHRLVWWSVSKWTLEKRFIDAIGGASWREQFTSSSVKPHEPGSNESLLKVIVILAAQVIPT